MLNARRVCIIALALSGLAITLTPPTQAQIKEVDVQVKGLSCPFCVKGVEKHLKKVEGVTDVSTSLKKGMVKLHYKPGSPFDVDTIKKAVVRGGFTPGDVELFARGKVERSGDDFLFTIPGTPSSFLLFSPTSAGAHKAGEAVTENNEIDLERAITADKPTEISGKVHSHKNAKPGLSIERVETSKGDE